jgi:hypothetical protein
MTVIVGEIRGETEPARGDALPGGPVHASRAAAPQWWMREHATRGAPRMADQVGPGTLDGELTSTGEFGSQQVAPAEGQGSPGKFVPHHGRPVSWVSVSIIFVGFIIGGIALIVGPTWWLLWVGAAVAVIGGILGMATGIFNDWY